MQRKKGNFDFDLESSDSKQKNQQKSDFETSHKIKKDRIKKQIETPRKNISRKKSFSFSSTKSPRRRTYHTLKNLRKPNKKKGKEIQQKIETERWSELDNILILGSRNFSKINFSPSQFGRRFLKRVKGDK